ncbi:MAG: tripartite tricarboxylate transporter permease, partial [Burkholderiaceae bacterium]
MPTLLFGIPGSGSMAILLGGFVLIGIEPGVDMVTYELDLVYLIIWSVALANIIGAGTCFILAPQISKLTTIKYTLLAPIMFGLIFFAAFQATRSWGDLIALFIVSLLGIYMKRFGCPRPALLIGFVLADQVEELVYQTFTVYG